MVSGSGQSEATSASDRASDRPRAAEEETKSAPLRLEDGSRIAVVGGGPAGSLFAYFTLDMAQRVGIAIEVDVYEPRDFSRAGPGGCNMCGGIVSESLVQMLAVDGINLPPTVVQRGIDSYVLHMDDGSVRIDTPLHEKRIAVVHRGGGPRDIKEQKWGSFDGFLMKLARDKGARRVRGRVDGLAWRDGRPEVKVRGGSAEVYDLLVAAVGVNSPGLKLFEGLMPAFKPPKATKTYICEFCLGQEVVERHLGNSMHVFLLNLPRLEFAALIPKGDYVTVCLLGDEVDPPLVRAFLDSPEVKACLPPNWQTPENLCHCSPRINIEGAAAPFADRLVFIGDCGVTRLYKDGIGAAYRTAKAAAVTAVFDGVSAEDFRRHFWPTCQGISRDNGMGKLIFMITRLIQRVGAARRGVLTMVAREQRRTAGPRRMSSVLWDVFTGSAPYRDVFLRTLHPAFIVRFLTDAAIGLLPRARRRVSPVVTEQG